MVCVGASHALLRRKPSPGNLALAVFVGDTPRFPRVTQSLLNPPPVGTRRRPPRFEVHGDRRLLPYRDRARPGREAVPVAPAECAGRELARVPPPAWSAAKTTGPELLRGCEGWRCRRGWQPPGFFSGVSRATLPTHVRHTRPTFLPVRSQLAAPWLRNEHQYN
jgi:hypothetical protein